MRHYVGNYEAWYLWNHHIWKKEVLWLVLEEPHFFSMMFIWRAYLQNVLSPSTIKIEIYTEMCSYLLQVFSNVFILWQTLLISQLQPYKYFVYWQTELSPSPVYGQTELSPWREPSLWILVHACYIKCAQCDMVELKWGHEGWVWVNAMWGDGSW